MPITNLNKKGFDLFKKGKINNQIIIKINYKKERNITMSEKAYSNMIDQGVSYFKRCLDAKTPKNKISHAEKSLKYFKKAEAIARKLKIEDKIAIMYEYITQLYSIIAISNLQMKKLPETIDFFNKALKANKKTKDNKNKFEREAFMLNELAKLSARINLSAAVNYANRALSLLKKLDDNDKLDLLIDLNPVFYKALEPGKIYNNYKLMIKLVKKTGDKPKKAAIYFEYAKFLFEVKNKYNDALEYLNKAKTIYNAIHEYQASGIVEQYIKEHFDNDNRAIKDKKEEGSK
ncbi:MAG: hypothetical protein ACTSU2_05730 [Promethearchaeota archaeon]